MKKVLFFIIGTVLFSFFFSCGLDNKSTVQFDSLAFEADTLGTPHLVDYGAETFSDTPRASVKFDLRYPVSGDTFVVNTLRKWMALRLDAATMLDTLPDFISTFQELAQYYGTRPTVFKGSLNQGKELMSHLRHQFFSKFRADSEQEGYYFSYELYAKYLPEAQTNRLITMFSQVYTYLGGAHGFTENDYTHFDLKEKRFLRNSDFLKPNAADILRPVIQEGLVEYFNVESVAALDSVLFESAKTLPLPKTIGLTPKGLAFQYQSYEIAPYSEGMPCVTVPYSKADSALTVFGKEIVASFNEKSDD